MRNLEGYTNYQNIDESRAKLHQTWRYSVEYFNRVFQVTDGFVEIEETDLRNHCRSTALKVMDDIARAAKVMRGQAFLDELNEAINRTAETISILYIAKSFGMLRVDLFDDLYMKGRLLVGQLQELSLQELVKE